MKFKNNEEAEFYELIGDYLAHEKVQEMKNYIQHGHVTTYDHCLHVAKDCFIFNRRHHLHADEKVLVVAALLHDFYLYDWHHKDGGAHDWHGFHHPGTAGMNAFRIFHISKHTQDIIRSHMWPLTITRFPTSREAWIVCMIDKMVSAEETVLQR